MLLTSASASLESFWALLSAHIDFAIIPPACMPNAISMLVSNFFCHCCAHSSTYVLSVLQRALSAFECPIRQVFVFVVQLLVLALSQKHKLTCWSVQIQVCIFKLLLAHIQHNAILVMAVPHLCLVDDCFAIVLNI